FYSYCDHRVLHSFPTRRSSDLHGPIRLPTPRAPGAQRPATRDAAHAARRRGGPQVRDDEVVRIPHTTIRRTIAANLTASLHTAADRKSTRLNSSHVKISYAVFC